MRLLVPEEFPQFETFTALIEPNGHLNAAIRLLRGRWPLRFGDALEVHSGVSALDGQANPLKALAAARQSTVDPNDVTGLDDDHAPVVH